MVTALNLNFLSRVLREDYVNTRHYPSPRVKPVTQIEVNHTRRDSISAEARFDRPAPSAPSERIPPDHSWKVRVCSRIPRRSASSTGQLNKLVFYARNPRKNDSAVDRMCSSIREFGFKIPCSPAATARSSTATCA